MWETAFKKFEGAWSAFLEYFVSNDLHKKEVNKSYFTDFWYKKVFVKYLRKPTEWQIIIYNCQLDDWDGSDAICSVVRGKFTRPKQKDSPED